MLLKRVKIIIINIITLIFSIIIIIINLIFSINIITLIFSYFVSAIEDGILDICGLYLFLGKISYNLNICRTEYDIVDGGILGDIFPFCLFIFNYIIIFKLSKRLYE